MDAATLPGVEALTAIRSARQADYYTRPNDETKAREGRLAALRNFASTAVGDMSVSEFEEIGASVSESGAFGIAYRETLRKLSDLVSD